MKYHDIDENGKMTPVESQQTEVQSTFPCPVTRYVLSVPTGHGGMKLVGHFGTWMDAMEKSEEHDKCMVAKALVYFASNGNVRKWVISP